MQAQTGFPTFPHSERDRAILERLDHDLTSDRVSVRLEISIHADTRRLFHALTHPEYLEAWLCLPGDRPGCSTIADRRDRDYLVEHFCEGRQSVLISGRYLALRRRHVVFSWRVDGDFSAPDSEVEIRLRGDFERTTLILEHRGFASHYEAAWHRALWDASMARLMALYAVPDRPQLANQRRPVLPPIIRGSRTDEPAFRTGYERAS